MDWPLILYEELPLLLSSIYLSEELLQGDLLLQDIHIHMKAQPVLDGQQLFNFGCKIWVVESI